MKASRRDGVTKKSGRKKGEKKEEEEKEKEKEEERRNPQEAQEGEKIQGNEVVEAV